MQTRHITKASNTMLLACSVFIASCTSTAIMAQPDFSGAWTVYRNTAVTGAVAAPTATLKLVPEAQAAWSAYRSLIEGTNYAPGNACVGYGMPDSMLSSGVYPMEIIQRPDQVFVIHESHNEMRRLFIGDAARDPMQFFPERNGYSTAHWEGDRLIVETSRLKTQVDTRYPHSNQATKRWQEMKDYHVLTYECSEPEWLDEMAELYEAAGLTMVQE